MTEAEARMDEHTGENMDEKKARELTLNSVYAVSQRDWALVSNGFLKGLSAGRKELASLVEKAESRLALATEALGDIHDVAFDGDGLKTAKELGKDIAWMAKKALSSLRGSDEVKK